MPDQTDFLAFLDAAAPEPPKDKPRDGMACLHDLVEREECLIFLDGANDHLRFIRTHASDDIGAVPVDHPKARAVLLDGGYHRRGRMDTGRPLASTGYNQTACVWGRN